MSEQPTLRLGDETADGWVECLQEVLNYNLLFLGSATQVDENGRFDDATDGAVRRVDERQLHGGVAGAGPAHSWRRVS